MNPQYETLAKCLLPEHMLEWFELTNVEVKPKEKKSTRDKQPDDIPVNVIRLYLDENELTPDNREDLRPNGFTPAKTFHDFPIRGQEVLLHVRRRRWLDAANHNVMSEFDFIQESTRCSKELAEYAKVGEFDNKAFNDIAAAMYDREDEILNYFVNRSTNASAESLNAKFKDFRDQLRGVIDKKFFIFRLVKIFG